MTLDSLLALAAVLAPAVLIVSESFYIRKIWKRAANPNPISWLCWTIGAWFIVRSTWLGGQYEDLYYLATIAVLTSVIFVLSVTRGKGRAYIGWNEAVCLAIAGIAAYFWFAYDLKVVVFAAGLAIDLGGAISNIRSAWKRPQDEPLLPWQLTVLSAMLYFPVAYFQWDWGNATLEDEGRLVFATYYLVANYLILHPLIQYYGLRDKKSVSPAE